MRLGSFSCELLDISRVTYDPRAFTWTLLQVPYYERGAGVVSVRVLACSRGAVVPHSGALE